MTHRIEKVAQNGPPQALISQITHFHKHIALNNYLSSHPQLRKEIEDRSGVVHGLKEPDAHNTTMEDDCPDNLDILSSLIIQEVLRINISTTEDSANC